MFNKLFDTLSVLPVAGEAEKIVASILGGNVAILSAATGSGKTLFASTLLAEKSAEQVVVMVPRRFLAVNAAETIAEIAGVELGREVGYCIGKQSGEDSKFSPDTKLLFVTYGYAISSGLVNRAPVIVLDEVHEADIDMSICRALIQRRMAQGEKVNLMEMSATINAGRQAAYWQQGGVATVEVFEVEGTAIDCEVSFEKDEIQTVVGNLLAEDRKGILVFRPGVADVKGTAEDIRREAERREIAVDVHVIYGDMSAAERRVATAAPENGVAKVLVGTNVVESGVNLMWLDAGVTCGTGKLPVARDSGAVMLDLVHLSKWRLEQQKGRLTRHGNRADKVFGAGKFVLVSSKSWEEREAETLPEIVRLPLTELVMHCARFGLRADELTFDFPPKAEAVIAAEVKLQRLGLITEDCKLTQAGQFVSGMPVGPETGAMLWHAKRTRVLGAFLPLAAVIEAEGVRKNFKYSHGLDSTSDYLDSLKAYQQVQEELFTAKQRGWKLSRDERTELFEEHNVGFKRYETVSLMLRELKRRFNGDASSTMVATDEQLRQCILAGLIDQLFKTSYGTVSTLDGWSSYNLGNGSALYSLNTGFAVGRLRTIVPRNGNRPFTVFEKATVVTFDDIMAVAKVRPELVARAERREQIGYFSFQKVITFTIFGEYELAEMKEESPLTDQEVAEKATFEAVRDPLAARLESLNKPRQELGMETIRCGDDRWQIGSYGSSREYTEELVADVEARMKTIVLECHAETSALSEARVEVELNAVRYTDDGFKFGSYGETYAYTAEGIAKAKQDTAVAIAEKQEADAEKAREAELRAENAKVGYARIESLNARRTALGMDTITVDSDEDFYWGGYKHVSNLEAIAEMEADMTEKEEAHKAEAEAEILRQHQAEREEAERREAEAKRQEAISRGKQRVENLNRRREALDWAPLATYEDNFEFNGDYIAYDDEAGLQRAETEVATEEKRLEDLRNWTVTSTDLAALAAHFGGKKRNGTNG
jgi:HrpA-like RNA helicase